MISELRSRHTRGPVVSWFKILSNYRQERWIFSRSRLYGAQRQNFAHGHRCSGSRFVAGVERQSFGLLRKLPGAVRDVNAWQFTRCPDVDRGGDIGRIVQRSALDAERLRPALVLMPEPRAAVRTEGAFYPPAAVGGASPEFWCALRHPKTRTRGYEGNSECRGRLLLAFPTMADIKLGRSA